MNLCLGDNQLVPVRVLGQGTFGRVFLARCEQKSVNVCVKRIIVHNQKTEMKMILEEVYIISQLKHPRIVKFIRSFVHAGTVNIVMEYLPNGTIRDLLNRMQHVSLSKRHVLRYFLDILMGLEYLHIRHVIHRDLKPENLMFDAQYRIKICDFGISTIHTPLKQRSCSAGTPYYMAPEVMRGEKFDFKSDIWSLGCILYEICMGKSPFNQATDVMDLRYLIRVLTRQTINCQMIERYYGPVWAHCCQRMLCYDPAKRITLPDIVCIDPLITIPFYQQYTEYNYN